MIGRTLSHYEIIEELSRGGMGVVYRALDVKLGREVALKVLPESLLHDPGRRERLLHEARAASKLEHPYIAVIHEVDDVEGVTFIAMELVRGEKLSDTISHGRMPAKRALDLGVEIAEGLARAHEKGVIHRDVKPANVMVTEEGHAKIIDFGLARLDVPVSDEAATASVGRAPTEPGVVMGTAAYMSPEQARGVRIDHRSDIFSLGVTLYEMLTGRPAFRGGSSIETMHAILTQPMPPLAPVAGLADEAAAAAQRVIDKCTAKDADERYQGMRDVVVDLRAARRLLESSQGSMLTAASSARTAAPVAAPRSRNGLLVLGLAAVVAIAAAIWWSGRRAPVGPAPSGKPAVAVLYFENNTGDPSLDWMRTGLTDMLVTDLSQSTDFEVVGTDRLVQILQELKRTDDRVIPADAIQQIAERAAVTNVLVGSFVKAGDAIRINARLQEARTGRIVTAERVEGSGEASLFTLVDELTRRFRTSLATTIRPIVEKPGTAAPEDKLDRDITSVTSSNIEAYRYYLEGLSLHERGLFAQAIPPMEKAVELDPDFAMALAKLAVLHNNVVHLEQADEYAKRALAHVSRLTARERYYIEGFYYTQRPETLARGIEAYRQGLALHPEHHASRHNLALKYFQLERFQEALEQYEELARRGATNPTTLGQLADSYLAVGNPARSLEITQAMVKRRPDSAASLRFMGSMLIANGRLDEARAAVEKSASLDPRNFPPKLAAAEVASLQSRWADAEAFLRDMGTSGDPFQVALGLALGAEVRMGLGAGQPAIALLERAARAPGYPASERAAARRRLSQFQARMDHPAEAVAQAEQAAALGDKTVAEFETLEQLAIAQAVAGRHADSAGTISRLESRVAILPSPARMRRVHIARGASALVRGDSRAAIEELTKAEGMLAVNGPALGPPSAHPEIWYTLALAYLKAGRDADAAIRLEKLQTRYERFFDLDGYGRSFYLLGQIYDRRGDAVRAREQFTRFIELRGNGDLDRGWIADARKRISR